VSSRVSERQWRSQADEAKQKLFIPVFYNKGQVSVSGYVSCSEALIPTGRDCNDDLSAIGIAGRLRHRRQAFNPPRLCKCMCRIEARNGRLSGFISVLVASINSRLRSADTDERTMPLKENGNIAFQGVILVGAFELDGEVARKLLQTPVNPNGRPNSDVIRPLVSADDITGRDHGNFLIDFTEIKSEAEAALYEQPFEYIRSKVKAHRADSRSGDKTGVLWWRLQRGRPKMRKAFSSLTRYIATPRVSKHRVFAWVDIGKVPDTRLFVFARSDDYAFGVLHS
jgi:hypothetical protein